MTELIKNITTLKILIHEAQTILVLQPEKPDTDSITSSLALEQILGDLGKDVILYCKDDIPKYISYFEGADRIHNTFPHKFDMSILVDTGGPQQVARTLENHRSQLFAKPFAVIDHHPNRTELGIETLSIVDPTCTSTCELIEHIARIMEVTINKDAADLLIPGILADTRNLAIPSINPEAFEVIARLMRLGGDVYKSHEAYRSVSALSAELLQLKGRLLSRMELFANGKIALIVVEPSELAQYAEMHDPSDLVIYDMQWAIGVEVAVVMRNYRAAEGNKIKVSTRARMPVAADACNEFGGGGHDRAAGCVFLNMPIEEAKSQFVDVLARMIETYEKSTETSSV